MLGQPGTGAADAALHLVEVQQRALAVAGRPRRLEEAGGRHDDAGLAEHRLEHDRGGRAVDGGRERGGVAVRDEGDRAGQRLERRPLGRLAGDRQGAHRAAVEGAVAGDPAAAGRAAGREILSAASLASAPELVNSTRSWPVSSCSRSASRTTGSFTVKLLTWPSVDSWRSTASRIAGWACPSALTAIPAYRSR